MCILQWAMKRLSFGLTHTHVAVKEGRVCSKIFIREGTIIGMITGVRRTFRNHLFLQPGCFYIHTDLCIDARHSHNPIAWIEDGFFSDEEANVSLAPLSNENGYIFGFDVVATKNIYPDDPIIYHTWFPI